MKKKKRRHVSLYLEWRKEDQSEAISKMLLDKGVHSVEINSDVDLQDPPDMAVNHQHCVLQLCIDYDAPVWLFLSDIAMHPAVFSVAEM